MKFGNIGKVRPKKKIKGLFAFLAWKSGESVGQSFYFFYSGHRRNAVCAFLGIQSPIIYKYWLLMREIVQNNSPRWLETVGYYISRDEVEGNIGTRSPVNEGSYFAQFHD